MVYLVGAGPGDPGLLTRRAARLLRRADVVVYDALIDPRLLDLAPPSAERIDVGKRCGGRQTSQDEIHRQLIEAAGRAAVVVRLKGGDPFVFGRGGEEALALAAAGIRFEVVPGVTAGVGAPAYAGIPLTHRGLSSAATLATGHDAGGSVAALPKPGGTLVIYMGMRRLEEIVKELLGGGWSPEMPAAAIEWGTFARQRTVTGALSELPARVGDAGLGAPAVVVVGDVVSLRDRLNWFESRPLFGVRVLVPRSRPQPSRLVAGLDALGAEVVEFPRPVLLPPRDPAPLRRALGSLRRRYGWVLLTSTSAAARFWEAWREAGRDARRLAGVRFVCCGTATVAALERCGVRPEVALTTYDPLAVLDAMGAPGVGRAGRVLFPTQPELASSIAERLEAAGYAVDRVEAYHAHLDVSEVDTVRRRLGEGEIDVVALSSSGTVRSLVAAAGPDVGRARVVAIGPETVEEAAAHGIPVHVVAGRATLQGLIDAVSELAGRGAPGPAVESR